MITENHPELTFPDTQSRYFWKLKQSIAIRQASIVATVSEYSKSQIQFRCKVPNSRMRIISEAADPIFKVLNGDFQHDLLKRFDLKAGELFLLYVGGISPHKNLSNLIKAFAQIRAKTSQNIRLLLVGDYKDDPFLSAFPALAAEVKKLDLDESVSFTGFVSDVELVHLYNAATVMVFPSLDEGFGLPAIEAMACGTPVAASDRGSLKEVLQDAGVYFDPTNITEMVNVVVSILENAQKRDSMRKSGLLRAGDFQWNKSAKDALAIFQEIVSN